MPTAGSACYFFIIIFIRYKTTAAARWALLLIVRTLFNDAVTVAVWTDFGFHVCSTFTTLNRGSSSYGCLRSSFPAKWQPCEGPQRFLPSPECLCCTSVLMSSREDAFASYLSFVLDAARGLLLFLDPTNSPHAHFSAENGRRGEQRRPARSVRRTAGIQASIGAYPSGWRSSRH